MAGRERQGAKDLPRGRLGLADVIREAQRRSAMEISVAYPAEVVSFDPDTQLASVRCDFSHVFRDDGGEQVLSPEVLPNIMVAFEGATPLPQFEWEGGYLSFPVPRGSKGWVTVFDRSVERWTSTGDGGDPGSARAHARIDGVFKPGLRDVTRAIPNFDNFAAVLESQLIKIGAGATEAAVLGSTMRQWAIELTNFITAHTHSGVQPGAGVSGTSGLAPTVPNFLSTKVRIG